MVGNHWIIHANSASSEVSIALPPARQPWPFAGCGVTGPGKKMGPGSQEAGGFWVTLGQNYFPSLGFIFSSAKLRGSLPWANNNLIYAASFVHRWLLCPFILSQSLEGRQDWYYYHSHFPKNKLNLKIVKSLGQSQKDKKWWREFPIWHVDRVHRN